MQEFYWPAEIILGQMDPQFSSPVETELRAGQEASLMLVRWELTDSMQNANLMTRAEN